MHMSTPATDMVIYTNTQCKSIIFISSLNLSYWTLGHFLCIWMFYYILNLTKSEALGLDHY